MDKKFQEKTMSVVVGPSNNGEPIYNGHKKETDKQKVFRNNFMKTGTNVENSTERDVNETLQKELKNFNGIRQEIIFQLLFNDASIYDKNANGETLMHAAFKEGCYDALWTALTNLTPNFNPANKDDMIHFHIACVTNHYLVVENFVKCGLDPNSPISLDYAESSGLNPLEFAIQKNYSELFVTLLKHNGDLSRKNANGLTPLHMIYYSKLQNNTRKYWLEQAFMHGNDTKFINSEDEYGVSHFHLCCIINELDFTQVFIDNGANVNGQVSLTCPLNPGFTPLHFAVINGCQTVTELLLSSGADPNKPDKEGKTPLHLAAGMMEEFSNNTTVVVNIVRILLKYRALPIIADMNGATPLHVSFYNAKTRIFNIIVNTLVLIPENDWGQTNYTDKHGLSLFHIACARNALAPIYNFLESGVDVNSRVSSGMYGGCTALHFSVMFNYYYKKVAVEILLASGAKVNEKDNEFGDTPLGLACEKFQFPSIVTSIRPLLIYKASTVIPDKKGRTPLHKCLYSVDKLGFKMFDMLVPKTQWGSDNFTDDQGLSLFHIACTTNKVDQVAMFLDSGVHANSRVSSGIYSGFTALHFAVMHNQKEVVEILLEKNVNVNGRAGKSAATPLHLACELNCRKFIRPHGSSSQSNQMDIIELLLSHGADVDAKDSCGMTPLLLACVIDNLNQKYWSDTLFKLCDTTRASFYYDISIRLHKIIKILISNKADINARTKNQSTALHIISKYKVLLKNSERLVKILINSGLEVNAVDAAGLTALHVATRYSSNNQLKCLLNHEANPHIKCNKSKTPVHFAADRIIYRSDENEYFKEQRAIFCTLAEYGSDVNMRYAKGRVLLHEAMRARKYSFVYELLKYGADINMEDSDGNCSVSYLVEQPPDRNFLIILTHIFFHMKWLEALKIPINPKVQNICDQLHARYESDLLDKHFYVSPNDNYDKCRAELDMFKNVKIDSYTMLYHILKKDPHELIKHVKNTNLIKIATDENVYKNFPLYGYLLKRQIKRGLIRSEVTQSADTALRNVLNINLPDLCCDLVLKYLKNDEIADLVKAATIKRKPSDNSSENKTVRNLPKTESR